MLTNQENFELIRLLNKIEWPVRSDLFDAFCGNMLTSPVDLALLKKSAAGFEIFLIYRKDKFFDGWHVPGSVMLPGRTVLTVLKDVMEREINIHEKNFDFKFIGFHQFMKGHEFGQCSRGQETELLYVLFLEESTKIRTDNERKFFSIEKLPDDILSHHQILISSIKNYLNHVD
ncbi:MAG: hypothetical protein Q7K40_02300 [bacterium]|nr:hypothetical protein [bacterium]